MIIIIRQKWYDDGKTDCNGISLSTIFRCYHQTIIHCANTNTYIMLKNIHMEKSQISWLHFVSIFCGLEVCYFVQVLMQKYHESLNKSASYICNTNECKCFIFRATWFMWFAVILLFFNEVIPQCECVTKTK